MMYRSRGKIFTAFTLAEILITLAVIGIVALLVIPNFLKHYQQRAWNTAANVFEKRLQEALKSMNAQETLAGYTNTKDFVNELSKHIKITKICDNDDITSCFEEKVYWGSGDIQPKEVEMSKIKSAKNFGQDAWNTDTVGLHFSNGVTGVIAYNPDCTQNPYNNQVNGVSCIALLYDITAYKNPNTSGKDLRGINVKSLGNNCILELEGMCFNVITIDAPMTMAECNAEKEDLGLSSCCDGTGGYGGDNCDDNDYFGAAVKACGGMTHIPSITQLNTLGKYLYNNNDFFILSDESYQDYINLMNKVNGKTEEEINAIITDIFTWDDERVASSGIPIFEQALVTYTNQRSGILNFQVKGVVFTNGNIIEPSTFGRKVKLPYTLCIN